MTLTSKPTPTTGPDADWLDASIRAAAPEAVPDDGFSLRVLAQLPPVPAAASIDSVQALLQREQAMSLRHDLFLAAACLLGMWFSMAILGWPSADGLTLAARALLQWPPTGWRSGLPLLSGLLASGVLVYALLRGRAP